VETSTMNDEDEYRRYDAMVQMTSGTNPIFTKNFARKQIPNVDPVALEKDEIREQLKAAALPAYQQMINAKAMISAYRNKGAEDLQNGVPPMMPQQGQTTMQPQPQGNEMGRRLSPNSPQRAVPGSMEQIANQRPVVKRGVQGNGGGGNRR
jgi:hypothetical protein